MRFIMNGCPNLNSRQVKMCHKEFGVDITEELAGNLGKEKNVKQNLYPHFNHWGIIDGYDNSLTDEFIDDKTELNVLNMTTFESKNQLDNYLKNTIGFSFYKGNFYIVKDTEKSKNRKKGEYKVDLLNKNYPGLITIRESLPTNNAFVEGSSVTKKVEISYSALQAAQQRLLQKNNNKVENIDDKIDKALRDWATKAGVTIEAVDVLKDRLGNDVVASASMIDKTIKIVQEKADKSTLPEEIAHMALEMLKDNSVLNSVYKLAREHETYNEVVQEYGEVYKNNEDLLVKETAGKLLARHIQNNKEPNTRLGRLLETLWNKMKSIFGRSSIKSEIAKIYGELANNILNGNMSKFDIEKTTDTDSIFYQVGNKDSKDMTKLEKDLEKVIKKLAEQTELLKRRGKEERAVLKEKAYEKAFNNFKQGKNALTIITIMRNMDTELKAVDQERLDLINKYKKNNNLNIQETASSLRYMKSTADMFKPIIETLKYNIDDVDLKGDKNYTAIANKLNELEKVIVNTENLYKQLSVPLFATVLAPKTHGRYTKEELKELLRKADKDINWFDKSLNSLAECNDDVLKIIDELVQTTKRKSMNRALSYKKELERALLKLEKFGIKGTEWMYEKLKNGDLTGNLISEYNYGLFDSNLKAESERIDKKFGFTDFKDKEIKLQDIHVEKEYKKEWGKWFSYNTQEDPKAKELIENKRKSLSEEDFNDWYEANTRVDTVTGEVKYIKELTIPSEFYKNNSFSNLNPAQKEFYDTVIRIKKELTALLPEHYRDLELAPQIRKDLLERMKRGGMSVLSEQFADNFIRREDDVDFGMVATDENNNPVNLLPIYYTKKLENPNDLSTDIVSTLSAFAEMTTNYDGLNSILDVLELGKDVIGEREVTLDKSGKRALKSFNFIGKRMTETVTKKAREGTMMYERLEDFYNMVVYGKYRKDEGSIKLGKTHFDIAKTVDAINRFTSINSLAFNVYSAINNPILGSIMIRQEAFAGEFINTKSLMKARTTYAKEMVHTIANMGKRVKTDKLSLWTEKFNVLQDFSENIADMDMNRRTMASRLFKTSTLFALNTAGEHWMQVTMSMALAYNKNFKDKDGNTINMWDAYEVVENELKLKKGVTNEDGSAVTVDDEIRFTRRQDFINQRLHGIYNKEDRNTLQQYALGRTVMMFRKFLVPAVMRRWGTRRYSFKGNAETEGFYLTAFRIMKSIVTDIRHAQTIIQGMEPFERANMIRFITEMSYALAATILIDILENISGDDDDDWHLNMLAYQSNRLLTELSAYYNPGELLVIANSPAASVDTLEKFVKLLELTSPFRWGERYESGKYKGWLKISKASFELVPLAKTLTDIATPEEKVKFFNNK